MPGSGFSKHDHSHCMAEALALADAHCSERGLQLTTVRRRVLEILLEDHRALGAYEILDRLREEGLGTQPPVAYRALEFLQREGFVHRLEGQNAFIACSEPGTAHEPAFMICRSCAHVAETGLPPESSTLDRTARDMGFEIEKRVQEAEGLCPACAREEKA